MTQENLQKWIVAPRQMPADCLPFLEEMHQKFPYTQTFPLLILHHYLIHQPALLDEQLARLAYRISDRQHLYHLIQNIEWEETTPTSSEEIILDESSAKSAIENPSSLTTEIEPEAIGESEILKDTASENFVVAKDEWIDETQDEEIQEAETAREETIDSNNAFEKAHDSIGAVEDSASEDLPLTEDIAEQEIHQSETDESAVLEEELETDNNSSQVESEDTLHFSSYHLEDLTDEELQTPQDERTEEETPWNVAHSFTDWLRLGEKGNDKDRVSLKQSKDTKTKEIVEQFIQNEPRISKPEEIKEKKPFFNPQESAKKSIEENAIPVSETLARIYYHQGLYNKSIYVYEQLMLLNPEKKSFFADQIQKIQDKINL